MPEFLKTTLLAGPAVEPLDVLVKLLVALLLGGVVAWVYRHTRRPAEVSPSFPVTLVLLAILIAMVTQVIGDNVARAFSLVGALSIVRFRTVVRDTQDTAYVIFAVVVGMAIGASDLWVSIIGIGVVGLGSFLMIRTRQTIDESKLAFVLGVRLGLGQDLEPLLGGLLDAHLEDRELLSVTTARQGLALEFTYQTRLKSNGSPNSLVKALNRVDGVQSVSLRRRDFE
jgi:hypothetical protein